MPEHRKMNSYETFMPDADRGDINLISSRQWEMDLTLDEMVI